MTYFEALPPEKFGGELSFDFSRQGFWRRKFICCRLAGSWCGASDHNYSKYDGMEVRVVFTLCSLFCFWTCHRNLLSLCVLFVTSMNSTKLALAANPATPTALAEISGGEKNGMHYLNGFEEIITTYL